MPPRIPTDSKEEILENKEIGRSAPRYGRFRQLMAGNVISPIEDVTVPYKGSMVVAGELEVHGTLRVEGTLVVL